MFWFLGVAELLLSSPCNTMNIVSVNRECCRPWKDWAKYPTAVTSPSRCVTTASYSHPVLHPVHCSPARVAGETSSQLDSTCKHSDVFCLTSTNMATNPLPTPCIELHAAAATPVPACHVNVNINTLLAISEQDFGTSGELGPQAKGVIYLDTPLRPLHANHMASHGLLLC